MANRYLSDHQKKKSDTGKAKKKKVIQLKHADSGYKKKAKVGFSWTTLFFGNLVPLFRGQIKWFFISIILSLITFGIFHFIHPFIVNREYIGYLLENSYQPANLSSKKKLESMDMI